MVYPWDIDIVVPRMSDVQECRLVRTKTIARLKTVPELMADGKTKDNPISTSSSSE